jgi:hypothetical protein
MDQHTGRDTTFEDYREPMVCPDRPVKVVRS